jgi:protein PhnA
MSLKRAPELLSLLSTLSETDSEGEAEAIIAFIASAPASRVEQAVAQARALITSGQVSLEELGSEANRWFGETAEAQDWLGGVAKTLEEGLRGKGSSSSHGDVVKDSNGAVLTEGDTVQVIKDLKVKGGSSDLKRGTVIKKIHLIAGDQDNIECRVDGSTLVLKTMFLKKA